MGLYLDHVNTVLSKLRETAITSLSTNKDSEAYKAQIAVQRAVNRVWNARTWTFRQKRVTFSTSSGQSLYALPKEIAEPYSILSSVSPFRLFSVDEDLFDMKIPNPQSTGNPQIITLFDHIGVENQPSSASVITVVSSSSSDTSQTIVVRGTVNGEDDVEEISLNGTSNAAGTKSFTAITAISKSDVTVGRVTVTTNSGAVTNVTIAPQEKTPFFRRARLYPEPDSTITITVKHYSQPPILTKAYDTTQIPDRWDYVIDQYAFAFALQAKGQDQGTEFQTQFAVAEQFLKDDMQVEEKQSTEEVIQPLRALDIEEGVPNWVPSGFGVLVQP